MNNCGQQNRTSTCYGDMTTQIGHKSKHYNSEGYNVNGHDSYK